MILLNNTQKINTVDFLYLAEIVARKFLPRSKEPIKDTELYGIACEELVKCCEKYNPAVGPFDRYAMRAIRNGIVDFLRKSKINFESLNIDLAYNHNRIDIEGILIGAKLSENELLVIKESLNPYYGWKTKIAERLGVTKQRIGQIFSEACEKIRKANDD